MRMHFSEIHEVCEDKGERSLPTSFPKELKPKSMFAKELKPHLDEDSFEFPKELKPKF